jgi:hypothetical protein
MTYRVVNVTTGEMRAELHSFDQARELADQLANDAAYRDVYAVVELVTRYETELKSDG